MSAVTPRKNQRARTRKALLAALRELMAEGSSPSMEDVADRALVSRATSYRYYPSIQTMLLELDLDAALPSTNAVFEGTDKEDLPARLTRVPEALCGLAADNEVNFRRFLAAHLLDSASRIARGAGGGYPRGGRRFDMLDEALRTSTLGREQRDRVRQAAALISGPETFISGIDSCQMEREAIVPTIGYILEAIVEKAEREDVGLSRPFA